MEMTNDSAAVGRWYESPRTGTSASPGQGIESSTSDINSSVAEHMGAFFLDPSGSQRAARYYHQSMHSPYGSHGKSYHYFLLKIVKKKHLKIHLSDTLIKMIVCKSPILW